MKAIYRMKLDFGRMGKLTGIFVAEKDEVDSAIGSEIYFGEVLGKHSEISGPLEEHDISMVTDDQQAVEMFEKYNLKTGYNPLSYIQEEEE